MSNEQDNATESTEGELVEQFNIKELGSLMDSVASIFNTSNENQLEIQKEELRAQITIIKLLMVPSLLVIVFLMFIIGYLMVTGEIDKSYQLLTYILTFSAGILAGYTLKRRKVQ